MNELLKKSYVPDESYKYYKAVSRSNAYFGKIKTCGFTDERVIAS